MRLGEWLVHNGALTPEQVETALAYQNRWRCKFGQAVLELNMIPREPFLRLLAGHLKVAFIRPEQIDKVPATTVRRLRADVLSRLRVCPLRFEQVGTRGSVYLATHQPENLQLLDEAAFVTGLTIVPVLALAEDIERTLRRHGVLEGRHLEPIELPPEEDVRASAAAGR
ncbi:type II secretory pathway, ATPase [Stigmatella aurantiaca]|uniref:General secretory system II, protein E-like protein n=1 Tax=Stigmatella aurantiaca (strain DW4/3-1) TaxID=378806 RepID=Q08WC8_STIAD|nr:type II secretory pathway, ATPase [Stigmatella aurantiaca]ADO69260.1 general secretory system II, protein E-like protein [Stigmatella aurantiaca DW4/3-1]EAU64773.1 type II secretory pathway, ATPase [Stigmatella aurantiaca DW4/3-1]